MGGITFEYFLKALDPEKVKKEKNFTIRRVFKKYDKKNKGYINFDDLINLVYKEFQEEVDIDVLKEVVRFLLSIVDLREDGLEQGREGDV